MKCPFLPDHAFRAQRRRRGAEPAAIAEQPIARDAAVRARQSRAGTP